MDNKKTVKILKKLIANHNDRIACYEVGITETGEHELKTMLTHFVQVSKKNKEELSNEIRKTGGIPPDGAREGSKFLIAWTDVKKAIDRNELEEILNGYEQCERVIANAYDAVLSDHEDEFSTEEQLKMIKAQQKMQNINLREVIDLKGALLHK